MVFGVYCCSVWCLVCAVVVYGVWCVLLWCVVFGVCCYATVVCGVLVIVFINISIICAV